MICYLYNKINVCLCYYLYNLYFFFHFNVPLHVFLMHLCVPYVYLVRVSRDRGAAIRENMCSLEQPISPDKLTKSIAVFC